MNPILPLYYAAPDGEAHVWKNDPDTLWLYASNDRICGGGMDPWQHIWSTEDLIHWTDHGPGFDARKAVDWTEVHDLPAIDCIEKNGKYYYYFTAGGQQCVAFSDKPEGPFLNAKPIAGTEFPSCGDPAIFVDDDGSAYLYWGQFSLRGAKLKDNMFELEEDTIDTMLLTEEQHGFHEGSSMRKRGDTYYLVYCCTDRGAATSLAYAKSKSPLGPFTGGNIIIDNAGCDLGEWNNHGSIVCFHDQWYVMYHKACFADQMVGRKACMEPIFFDENGDIKEVEMTTQGIEGPIDAAKRMDAWRACRFERGNGGFGFGPAPGSGINFTGPFFWKTPVSGFRKTMEKNMLNGPKQGVRAVHLIHHDEHSEYLSQFRDGESAVYRYLDFGKGVTKFRCEAASYIAVTKPELHLDSPDGKLIGSVEIGHTGGWADWKTFECPVEGAEGVHALYVKTVSGGMGSRLCDLNWFEFE